TKQNRRRSPCVDSEIQVLRQRLEKYRRLHRDFSDQRVRRKLERKIEEETGVGRKARSPEHHEFSASGSKLACIIKARSLRLLCRLNETGADGHYNRSHPGTYQPGPFRPGPYPAMGGGVYCLARLARCRQAAKSAVFG